MSLFDIALIFGSALLAGIINAVAGGGTFFTFSALVITGVPSISANATSAIAMVPGYISSAFMYRSEIASLGRRSWLLSILSLVGGLTGAYLLLRLQVKTFDRMVPYLLLFATGIFAFSGRLRTLLGRGMSQRIPSGVKRILVYLFQFLVAVYGGFFGAGMGILMLAALLLTEGDDFHSANGLKNLLSIFISGIAILLFISAGVIQWKQAVLMIAGSSIGGYAGVAVARRFPVHILKNFVIGAGLLLSIYFFSR